MISEIEFLRVQKKNERKTNLLIKPFPLKLDVSALNTSYKGNKYKENLIQRMKVQKDNNQELLVDQIL